MSSPSVLFVCLGNICRSPTAEAIFRKRAQAIWPDIRVDSAGTADWHTGKAPDERSIAAAKRHGYDLTALRARQVQVEDFQRFDLVLAMDADNLSNLEKLVHGARSSLSAKAQRFLDFAPAQPQRNVPDPYYGGEEGFEQVIQLIEQASDGLIRHLQESTRD